MIRTSEITRTGWLLLFALLFGIALMQTAHAQTFSVLYNFGAGTDGANPEATLLRDKSGTLYGTTYYGGFGGNGTVFKLDTAGNETVLYRFAGPPTDGMSPNASLVMDGTGNLYGTTLDGGALDYGTVFKLTPTGQETILHSFSDGTDGGSPQAGLLLAGGKLYGTTEVGGDASCINDGHGCGVVFEMTTKGKETVLYSFDGGTGNDDGDYPYGGVIRDSTGNLYGTTHYGGPGFGGIVFELDAASGYTLNMLYGFSSGLDGGAPFAGVVRDKAGNLYGTFNAGTTSFGGVFIVDPAGTETVLYSFAGPPNDGDGPQAGLVRDAKGNLYGTTMGGGLYGVGTVFELSPSGGTWTERILHNFSGSDGAVPVGGLVRDSAGNLYGTTYEGGTYNAGVIFKIAPK